MSKERNGFGRGVGSGGVRKRLVASGEIFLLISMSFAIAFILDESLGARVSAEGGMGVRPAALVADRAPIMPTAGSARVFEPALLKGGFTAGSGAEAVSADVLAVGPRDGWVMLSDGPAPAALQNGRWAITDYGGAAGSPWSSQVVTLPNGEAATGWISPNEEMTFANGELFSKGADGSLTSISNPPGPPPATPQPSFLGQIFGGQAFGGGIGGALFSGLVWGAVAFGVGQLIGGLLGLSDSQTTSVSMGLGAGAFAGASLYLYGQNYLAANPGATLAWFNTGAGAFVIGAGIAAAIIILTWKEEKKELVRFECLPWEPQTGGSRCEECNDDPLRPCSEYRCKALGQACEIVNKGTEEEQCVWVGKGDVTAPKITPSDEALSPDGLRYIPDSAISLPNTGYLIQDNVGDTCLPAFTNLQFGFTTDEPAQCKIDYAPSDNYEEMNSFFVGETNMFLREHTQTLKVVNTEGEGPNVPEIGIDGTFNLWVRCIDANGNGMDSPMVAFSYCVDDGPDTTAPSVEGTNIEGGQPVGFNVDQIPGFEVYTNEPAECKWSRRDQAFSNMENEMECSTDTYQINANLDYVCSTTLTGIVDREDNWFYFRCKDREGNVMTTSHPFLLKGTEPLVINDVGPTGEFTGSTTVIPVTLTVETAHGAEEGVATCSFSNIEEGGRFIPMGDTGDSYKHNQTLDLTAGNYIYYFRCIDAGGNAATANTTFSVITDTADPLITRVFRDSTVLKLITSEEAKCYYSNTNCNYNLEDGSPLILEEATDRFVHTTPWVEDVTYYIKCEDYQGNQPSPDQCQMIVQASEL